MKRAFFGRQLLPVVLVLGTLVGCASSPKEPTVDKSSAEADQAIAAAEASIAKAKANDWIWRDTEKFLKEAQAAADAGENGTAIKLANKAKSQAESAVAQFNHEKNNPRGL